MTPWAGVRSALSYGSRCAQLPSTNGPRFDAEDCLTVNVYAPAVIPAREKLPVLFMINGGDLLNGAGDQHDGSLLAQDDHIIVVSFNYRLGVFGFLNLPGLSAAPEAAHGNFGVLDMEAALRWVRANIAAFGGSPRDVAIAGESAGAGSVCALLASPAARGLFSRAIMESGSCVSEPAADAELASLSFAAKAGCPTAATAAACLRALPEATLLDASAGYEPQFASGGPELPVPPAQAIASGRFNRVPVLLGTNRGAGHAMELAYLWPSFTNGSSLYAELTGPQLELSRQMIAYWARSCGPARPRRRASPRGAGSAPGC